MFTGIITDTTHITDSQKHADGLTLQFEKPKTWDDLIIGESIATDGVCLTVASIDDATYSCVLMPETLRLTSFGKHVPTHVNLERSLKLSDRMGGHVVQGHVDHLGKVTKITKNNGVNLHISYDPAYDNLVVKKGAVTINGVSLTIASVANNVLSVALVPHTLEHTTLSQLEIGSLVNLEFDVVGKYIGKIMEKYAKS